MKEVPPEKQEHPWRHVIGALVVVIGILGFMAFKVAKDMFKYVELTPPLPPAEWAAKPANDWPRFILLQHAEFNNHSSMEAGCASLLKLPTGEVVALTAGHLLGHAGGVRPGFLRAGTELDRSKLATLDKEIVSWKLFCSEDDETTDKAVSAAGLFAKSELYPSDCDQVLLRLLPRTNDYPVTPLSVRITPVPIGESLRVIGYKLDEDGVKQVVHRAKRIASTLGFTCRLEKPAILDAHSGAPILDENGFVVGIVTGGVLFEQPDSSGRVNTFTGHEITELIPVLATAIKSRAK